ncbi:BTB/POZ domain-containing protein POB1-like [Vicia villosa]|uniref:BTB/POZ domain-containing protein POB1-like n=1 Tax=Vicia villosa TaxID=3911 RepID=UPI00273B59CC|nr:BTB/POZ domain-containing protein POB1-like [Vicia villosa]
MSTINNNTNLIVMDESRNRDFEDADLSFVFNDSNFSDRIIQLKIMKDDIEVFPNIKNGSTSADRTSLDERRKEDLLKENANLLLDKADVDDGVLSEPQKDANVEVPAIGDEVGNADVTANFHMDYSAVVKEKTLYVSSSILAEKSSFFYKLFSNRMKESKQAHITVRITASEEAPFMELLKFMYNDSLYVTSPPRLMDILMAADKFGVASCMRYCIRILLNIPITLEAALLYLDLPHSFLMTEVVWPLAIAAKKYLVARYKDVTKHQEELMRLPLAGIMALLSSDELQVASEDVLYDFVVMWAQTQYPSLEERREILREKLIPFIRFPYMTFRKLKMIRSCNDFEDEVTSKLVLDALYFKVDGPQQNRILAAESASTSRFFIERSYKYHPIKVVEFEHPQQQCVVYLDLRREECSNLFPSGQVCSRPFHLGGHGFFLSAHCNMDPQSSYHCFGLCFGMYENDSTNFSVDYEFDVRSRPTLEYICKFKGNFIFTGGREAVGFKNFFSAPWTSFMEEDNLYFINDVLYLKVELTVRNLLD